MNIFKTEILKQFQPYQGISVLETPVKTRIFRTTKTKKQSLFLLSKIF